MLFKCTSFTAILHFAGIVVANVEKVVFTTPEDSQTLDSLATLHLDVLSYNHLSLRKTLRVAFPSSKQPHGLESWYLLDYLEPRRKYEVRICWAATQPTAFRLNQYTPNQLLTNLSLSASIAEFSEERQEKGEIALGVPNPSKKKKKKKKQRESGAAKRVQLYLQVYAAADYYTTNKTLMNSPPPVDVDIILDPYMLSILPKSLLLTVIYILLIFTGAWFLSDYIWKWLRDFSQARDAEEDRHRKKEHGKQHTE